RVDADCVDPAVVRDSAEPVERLTAQRVEIPTQASARLHGTVREAVHLLDCEPLTVEPADRDTPALCAQVDCGKPRHQLASPGWRAARGGSGGRPGIGPGGPGSGGTPSPPTPRHASTSWAGALESVTIPASSSAPTKASRALRCHFVPSKMP